MKAEVDTLTQQKGRTTNLPEDFVTGYYPNDDFDYVQRDVKSFSENPVNSLGGGFQVVRGNSYPTGRDVKNSMNLLPTANHYDNHSLLVSQAEVRAQRGAARGIPPALDLLVKSWVMRIRQPRKD